MATLPSAPVSGIAHGVSGDTELPLSTYIPEVPNEGQERCQSSDNSRETQRVLASPILREAQDKTNNPTSAAKLINTPIDPQSRTDAQSSGPHNVSQSLLSSERLPAILGYLSNRRITRASSLSTPTTSAISAFTASSK